MRVVDATLTFPTILIALLLTVSLGQGLRTIVIAVTLIIWARFARIVRGEVLAVKTRDFVALARVHGCSHLRIMAVHIVPNVMNTFMVLLTLHIGFVIIVEASLSFLGAGIAPPTPSWGQMVADGRNHIASGWWLSVVPGTAILLVVLAQTFGDWLRDCWNRAFASGVSPSPSATSTPSSTPLGPRARRRRGSFSLEAGETLGLVGESAPQDDDGSLDLAAAATRDRPRLRGQVFWTARTCWQERARDADGARPAHLR